MSETSQEWFKNGCPHRDGDLPAFVGKDEHIWYKNGQIHRDNDLPAIVRVDGTREWFKNGEPYRPASEEKVPVLKKLFTTAEELRQQILAKQVAVLKEALAKMGQTGVCKFDLAEIVPEPLPKLFDLLIEHGYSKVGTGSVFKI
jgi:hypothetical protein